MATQPAGPLGWRTHGVLALLVLAYAGSFIGRQVISVMIEPIKREFGASDAAMGLISGLAFAAVYVVLGLPAGRLADRYPRVRVLAVVAALWALATLLCGLAVGFAMLVLARMLVAAAEAPLSPASLSLVADLYPPRYRSLAISCFTGAPTLSAILGLSVGAWLVEVHGWRWGFFLISVPLGVLALVFGLLVREPPRGRWDDLTLTQQKPSGMLASAMELLRNGDYRLLISATALTTFGAFSLAMWNTSFLVRSHGLSLQEAGILAGVVMGTSAAIGSLFSGWLADRLCLIDPAWLLRIPLIGHLVSLASLLAYLCWPAEVAFMLGDLPVPTAILWCGLSSFFSVWWVAPSFNLLTQLVSPWQRATAIALQTMLSTLCGVGLGPLVTGALSDALIPFGGEESLRHALVLVNLTLVVPFALLVVLQRRRAQTTVVTVETVADQA
ncbi:putative sialic acid transporter [compost metagenome]